MSGAKSGPTKARLVMCAAAGCYVTMRVRQGGTVKDDLTRFGQHLYCSDECLWRDRARRCCECEEMFLPKRGSRRAAYCYEPGCDALARLRQFELWWSGKGKSPSLPDFRAWQEGGECLRCRTDLGRRRSLTRLCSLECRQRHYQDHVNHVRLSREVRGGPVPIDMTSAELGAIRVRSELCECGDCSTRLSFSTRADGEPGRVELDHIVGRGWGVLGPHIPENVRPLAAECRADRPRDCSDVTAEQAQYVLVSLERRRMGRPEIATDEQVDLVRSFVEWRTHAEAGGILSLEAYRTERGHIHD